MQDAHDSLTPRIDSPSHPRQELDKLLSGGPGPAILKTTLNLLSGVAGPLGGPISAWASRISDQEQSVVNNLLNIWLQRLEGDLREMANVMGDVLSRLDLNNEKIRERVESPEYMRLVNQAFRNWSSSESQEKREMLRKLLANAAGDNITGDDVISMFITWIDRYTETHFKVVAAVYQTPGVTKLGMWSAIDGSQVRDDSAEADLFKFITHELTTGYVIRQRRDTTADGMFVTKSKTRSTTPRGVMKTPFDNVDPYVLTGLGEQFVHYCLNELVPKISAPENGQDT